MTDPWARIKPNKRFPYSENENLNHDFYWYVEQKNNNPCILFKIKNESTNLPLKNKFPKINYINFYPINQDFKFLCVELLDKNYKDLFYVYAQDIISSSIVEKNEKVALNIFIKKAWRWQYLLQKGREKKLRDEKQKGLIGELLFLNDYLIPYFGEKTSVDNWFGPLKSSKDFEFPTFQVEVKTKRANAKPTIKISSENQLDIIPKTRLFIAVFGIVKSENENAKSLNDWCNKIGGLLLESNDPSSMDVFTNKLIEVGYNDQQDYSDERWEIDEICFYEVDDTFPTITSRKISSAITDVSYSIFMNQIDKYEISKENLLLFLNGTNT